MEALFDLKEKIIKIYYCKEPLMIGIAKFITAILILSVLNEQIGYDVRLKNIIVVAGISTICAFLPFTVFTLVTMFLLIAHVYAASPVLAALAAIILLILYCMLIGFVPKWSYMVVIMPFLYVLEIPYVIPILLGLIAGPVSIFVSIAGVVIYYFTIILKEAVALNAGASVEEILSVCQFVIDKLLGNQEMFLAIIVFTIVTFIVYFIRKIPFSYSFETAILVGLIVTILGFLIGQGKIESQESIGWMLMGTVISGIILYVIWFFRLSLDYKKMEQLQFEDDDYYYYVKAVPKVKVMMGNKKVKKLMEEFHIEERLDN